MMGLANGVHHLAISTGDVKAQIAFFTDVLGAELKALYWMHGAEGTLHAFVKLNDASYVAFVQSPAVAATEPVPGVSHANSYATSSAPGTMQHVALNVDSEADLLELRDRIRDRGYNVFGPLDHGFCKSIYFPGPEGLLLEVATSAVPIDEHQWIDAEVVELVGISSDELRRYVRPAAYAGAGGAVAQPPIDPQHPRMAIPAERYEWLMSAPDDEITKTMSVPDPPTNRPDLGEPS
jgi:catechol 2,3-dioxygenase-like lactoylglutathione lyase family enzyme